MFCPIAFAFPGATTQQWPLELLVAGEGWGPATVGFEPYASERSEGWQRRGQAGTVQREKSLGNPKP